MTNWARLAATFVCRGRWRCPYPRKGRAARIHSEARRVAETSLAIVVRWGRCAPDAGCSATPALYSCGPSPRGEGWHRRCSRVIRSTRSRLRYSPRDCRPRSAGCSRACRRGGEPSTIQPLPALSIIRSPWLYGVLSRSLRISCFAVMRNVLALPMNHRADLVLAAAPEICSAALMRLSYSFSACVIAARSGFSRRPPRAARAWRGSSAPRRGSAPCGLRSARSRRGARPSACR